MPSSYRSWPGARGAKCRFIIRVRPGVFGGRTMPGDPVEQFTARATARRVYIGLALYLLWLLVERPEITPALLKDLTEQDLKELVAIFTKKLFFKKKLVAYLSKWLQN